MPNNYIIAEDYVHSANSLFHFMTSSKYLVDALRRKALCPRYCNEDIEYLGINNGTAIFREIAVLQKCFCDIPLHSVNKPFPVKLTCNNNLTEAQKKEIPKTYSHPELYGKYALAFSKKWGEESKMQPIHYLSENGYCTPSFSSMFNSILLQDEASTEISNTLLNWLCFIKPLRGKMKRSHETKQKERFDFEIFKNFHDEHEWRYVPFNLIVNGKEVDSVVANENILKDVDLLRHISDTIEKFGEAQLPFNYDDIRYIIVPDTNGRVEIIKAINELESSCFDEENEDIQRDLLISKILVLDDILKDF